MSSPEDPDQTRLRLLPVGGRGTPADVVRQLALVIQRNQLRLGDRLPGERELAAMLGVSRMTVRKGLRILQEAGVLEARSGRGRGSGSFVRSELIPPRLLVAPPTSFEEIADALLARRLFEPGVAVMAGGRAQPRDLAALNAVLEQQLAAGDDVARVRELDPSFHVAIARATHNEVILVMMQTLLDRLELSRDPPVSEPDEAQRTIAVHAETIAAIESGEAPQIRAAMRRHLRLLESAWETYTGQSLPPW